MDRAGQRPARLAGRTAALVRILEDIRCQRRGSEVIASISTNWVIEQDAAHVVQTYKRPPFVLARGEGVTVYDAEGNAYLDWVAGIAVNALGYGDPGLTAAIQRAAEGLLHTSNLYYTEAQASLAVALTDRSFADRVFFSNSGTEANEGALKFARRVAYDSGEEGKHELVCFTDAFHGRTLGSLSLTPKEKYQQPFKPLVPGVKVATFNDIASAREAITDKTAAVFIEPLQGEGGINAATPEFLGALRELCNQHGALLIFDEVQCGVGRTGTLWGHEPAGVTPDIMTLAKPLAGGLPIGAILTTDAVASHLHAGDHGSTFAGSPFITSVARYVLERIAEPSFLAHVRGVGEYLKERLEEINSPHIKQVRGRGLMVGMELDVEAAPLIDAGYKNGLLLVNAGTNVVRLVPPLVVQTEHVDTLVERLTGMLAAL
ncbi:MAG: acetylornithine/succinylornithine family transaminase [Chloroflexi bacterium]|nr:acetylornithine/succinylornithine family transaminase [Chloroflexota bacterium]